MSTEEKRKRSLEEVQANPIKPEVEAMQVPITYEKYLEVCNKYGMNSHERQFVYERMDDEAICKVSEDYLKQVTLYRPENKIKTTYEETLCMLFVPLLVDRLRNRSK